MPDATPALTITALDGAVTTFTDGDLAEVLALVRAARRAVERQHAQKGAAGAAQAPAAATCTRPRPVANEGGTP